MQREIEQEMAEVQLFAFPEVYRFSLTLMHSERSKLYTILAFLSAIELNDWQETLIVNHVFNTDYLSYMIAAFGQSVHFSLDSKTELTKKEVSDQTSRISYSNI